MSQEPTISSSDDLSLFQPKVLAAIDYNINANKQRPDAEAIYRYIVNSIDELPKQNVVVN